MKLSPIQAHVVVALIASTIATTVYSLLSGYGYYSFGPAYVNRNGIAGVAAFLSFGLYYRYCHAPVAPNAQGIQLFFGAQTGTVWGEGNFHFIPRPFWDLWKEMSVEHIVFTVAAQNRSREGHQMMVFATGRGKPTNAFAMAKLSTKEDLVTQLLGHSMRTIGAYIHRESRETLLSYPMYDLSEWFASDEENENFNTYDVQVDLMTTKVIEVNPKTMEQFDALARQKDMNTMVEGLKVAFPNMDEIERYAVYATLTGFSPAVMSHIVHGNGNFFFGSQPQA